jgi:multidrug efflux pump subunit AcrA (membrane-fusion protein)
MRFFVLVAVALTLTSLPVVLAGDGGTDPVIAGSKQKLPERLEDLLASAMDTNPDVLLAEAGVREATAKLNQVRLEVAQRAAALFHERKKHRTSLAALRQRYEEVHKLYAAGREQQQRVREIGLEMAEADAAIAQVDAEIRYLLGAGGAPRAAFVDRPFFRGSSKVEKALPARRPEVEDSAVKVALGKTMSVAWEETPIGEVAAALQKATGGELAFVLHPDISPDDYPITLRLPGEVEVGTVLVALADQLQDAVCFVFRDYGVLLVEEHSVHRLPGPAIPADAPWEPPAREPRSR